MGVQIRGYCLSQSGRVPHHHHKEVKLFSQRSQGLGLSSQGSVMKNPLSLLLTTFWEALHWCHEVTAWGNTPEPTASFSKQCRILLTRLKSGTGHRRRDQVPWHESPPTQGPLHGPTQQPRFPKDKQAHLLRSGSQAE